MSSVCSNMVLIVLGKLVSTKLRVASVAAEFVMSLWIKRSTVLSGVVTENLMVSAGQPRMSGEG